MKEIKAPEINEIKKPGPENFKNIQPEKGMTFEKAMGFWTGEFKNKSEKIELESLKKEYIQDLKDKSDCPDTISEDSLDVSVLEKVFPEENAKRREEFSEIKADLKEKWEAINERPWPKYGEDVYITNKKGEKVKIREAGMDYDAHHIQSLSHGGKNEVSNITPLRAEIHYDHRGIHASGSPYDKLDKMIGEN